LAEVKISIKQNDTAQQNQINRSLSELYVEQCLYDTNHFFNHLNQLLLGTCNSLWGAFNADDAIITIIRRETDRYARFFLYLCNCTSDTACLHSCSSAVTLSSRSPQLGSACIRATQTLLFTLCCND